MALLYNWEDENVAMAAMPLLNSFLKIVGWQNWKKAVLGHIAMSNFRKQSLVLVATIRLSLSAQAS